MSIDLSQVTASMAPLAVAALQNDDVQSKPNGGNRFMRKKCRAVVYSCLRAALTGPAFLLVTGSLWAQNSQPVVLVASQFAAWNVPQDNAGPYTWAVPQSGSGSNGIFNSLAECASLPYACYALAPSLYAQTEPQAFGGAFAITAPGQTKGPLGTQTSAVVLDQRYGVPQWLINVNDPTNTSHFAYGSRFYAWPSIINNILSVSPGLNSHPNGALNLQDNLWQGGRNFYTEKANYAMLQLGIVKYTQMQGGGDVQRLDLCYANGDCIQDSNTTESWGGPGTTGDEGTHATRWTVGQANTAMTGALLSLAADPAFPGSGSMVATTGAQRSPTNIPSVNPGTQGEGRLLIDTTHVFSSGTSSYISTIASKRGNLTYTCGGTCNWDSTYGDSTRTTLTALVGNPGNANTFPQTNVALSVASTTGFKNGDVACIWDYDYECEKITAVNSGALTVTIGLDRIPHPVGAYVTTGGMAGMAIEMESDRVGPGFVNGLLGTPSQILRQAFPIMFNSSGNTLATFAAFNSLPGAGARYNGRAYTNLTGSASGATCNVTVKAGAVTTVTVSGGSGWTATNLPQLVLAGIVYTTAPSVYVATEVSGALATAAIDVAGSGITGTPTCTVTPVNSYDIYPAAKIYQVYNPASTPSNGAVDGTLYINPPSGTFKVTDAIEVPQNMNQRIRMDTEFETKWFPSNGATPSGGDSLQATGLFGNNDTPYSFVNTANPAIYAGYPVPMAGLPSYGQTQPPIWFTIQGATGGEYFPTPPFGAPYPALTSGGMIFGCAPLGCSNWTAYYNAISARNATKGVVYDGLKYNPSISTWELTSGTGGASNCRYLFSPTGFSTQGACAKGALTGDTSKGSILKAALANAATTVNGVTCTLGSTCTVAPLVGTLTTTSGTSDNATVTGAASGNHCWVQATNSIAAGLTGVYTGTISANTVPVNHSGTSGGTFNVFCTPY